MQPNRMKKGRPLRGRPFEDRLERRAYSSSSSFFWARLSAAPRMSPRLAPESDEPKSAIAFFSSSSSRALTDSTTRRDALSMLVILASSLSPMA